MTREAARSLLEQQLIEDKESCVAADNRWLQDLLREGFPGFCNMHDAELVQCARDAGLDNKSSVAAAIAVLQG